jgi:hypothetical protein
MVARRGRLRKRRVKQRYEQYASRRSWIHQAEKVLGCASDCGWGEILRPEVGQPHGGLRLQRCQAASVATSAPNQNVTLLSLRHGQSCVATNISNPCFLAGRVAEYLDTS